MSKKKGYSIIEGMIRQSLDLPLTEWSIQTRKNGAEIYVECNDHSVFVGEGYSPQEKGHTMAIANVIVEALNEYEKAYESHDKGKNSHFDGY